MSEKNSDTPTTHTTSKAGEPTSQEGGIPIFEVWSKYEDIAMHFNDLLIKLRMQALGGVAAVGTIVTVISSRGGSNINWGMMTGVFFFLTLFWIAVWVLDVKYYNRLLIGAVDALLEIEHKSIEKKPILELNFSKKVENAVRNSPEKSQSEKELSLGRIYFYRIIFFGLLLGFVVSTYNLLGLDFMQTICNGCK